ncbi:hypothetical protein F2Q69_00037787 [Brassica cretica]|uniref:Uncharacterized protein n=1 Tax=Brassica cretica TaxID=69181 RepID=A0A8S9SIL6_BRACR|nr:hypothetical protein F2Q69_00037787 [Brassica cretica]
MSLLLSSGGGVGLCAVAFAGGHFLSLLPLLFCHCFLPLSTLRLAVALESSVELRFRIWDAGDVPWRGCSSLVPRSGGAFESFGLSHLGSARRATAAKLLAVSEGGFRRRVKLEVGLPARGDVWCSGVGPSDGFFVLSSLSQMVQAGGALSTGFELSGFLRDRTCVEFLKLRESSSLRFSVVAAHMVPLIPVSSCFLRQIGTSSFPCRDSSFWGYNKSGPKDIMRILRCPLQRFDLGCLMYTFHGGADLFVFCELFFDESDHKEQIIGEAKITGFCLS